jgi:hypothetical protein
MCLLITPLTELCFGLLKLQSLSARYLPYHLKLIEALNDLSRHTGQHIPTSTLCIDILCLPELQKPAKSTDEQLFEFELAIKMPKLQQRTMQAHQLLITQSLNLLLEYCAINSTRISFPELAIPLIHTLQKLKKILFVHSGLLSRG